METIGTKPIFSFVDDPQKIERISNQRIRESEGLFVKNYFDMMRLISTIQFRNQEYVLLFRGQKNDYKERNLSSIRPRIFRKLSKSPASRAPALGDSLAKRFRKLRLAENYLIDSFRGRGEAKQKISRQRIVRWSILQHYEICDTPLLDVSQSARIAASFASLDEQRKCYFYIFGIPTISGGITASAEAGIQIARLSSMCPPEAIRPHLQEGYLLGEYPELGDPEQAELYEHHEIDFALRLIAKFSFDSEVFWKDRDFPPVSKDALLPDQLRDPFQGTADEIKSRLKIAG